MVSQEEHNGGPLIEIIFTFIFSFDSITIHFFIASALVITFYVSSRYHPVSQNQQTSSAFICVKEKCDFSLLSSAVCVFRV